MNATAVLCQKITITITQYRRLRDEESIHQSSRRHLPLTTRLVALISKAGCWTVTCFLTNPFPDDHLNANQVTFSSFQSDNLSLGKPKQGYQVNGHQTKADLLLQPGDDVLDGRVVGVQLHLATKKAKIFNGLVNFKQLVAAQQQNTCLVISRSRV